MDIFEKNKYTRQHRKLLSHIEFEKSMYNVEIEYKNTKHTYIIEDYSDLEALEQVIMEYFDGSLEGILSIVTQYKKEINES